VVLSNWVAVILERIWGFGPGLSAALGSLVLLLSVVSRPLGGYLARRHPGCTRVVVLGALLAAATATAVLARPSDVAVAALAVGILGVVAGLPFDPAVGCRDPELDEHARIAGGGGALAAAPARTAGVPAPAASPRGLIPPDPRGQAGVSEAAGENASTSSTIRATLTWARDSTSASDSPSSSSARRRRSPTVLGWT
jgi:hypothetical protein